MSNFKKINDSLDRVSKILEGQQNEATENNEAEILKITDKLQLKFIDGKNIPIINGKEFPQPTYRFNLSFYDGTKFKVNLQTISVPYDALSGNWFEMFKKALEDNKVLVNKHWK